MTIPQHFSDDAPLTIVSCRMFQVLQQKMSSRCGSDLTCRTHSLDRPFCLHATHPPKPRHTLCVSRGNSLISLKMHPQLSNCRYQASRPSPIQNLQDHAIASFVRSIIVSHRLYTAVRNLCNEILGWLITVKSDLLGQNSTLLSGLGSSVLRGRFVASVSKASPPFLAQFVFCILRDLLLLISQQGQPGVVPYNSSMCRFWYVRRDRTVVHSSREGADENVHPRYQEWSSGIPRNTITEVQEFRVPRLFPSKSLQNCTCQGFLELATGIHRFSRSGQLFFVHRSSR